MNKFLFFLLLVFGATLLADGPADNLADKVRRVPPPGLKIADSDRTELNAGTAQLAGEIESLRAALQKKPALLDLLPDVLIYLKAVDWALRYDEFYKTNEIAVARQLLKQGLERAQALRDGKAPWLADVRLTMTDMRRL